MPEFDVPGSAAVFHNCLDDKRQPVPLPIAHTHSSGLSLAIDQDKVIFGDGGGHHRIGFPCRGDEGFGGQMLLFFQVQQFAHLFV
jgi:hypothetical protein